jgi:hypothetical protein
LEISAGPMATHRFSEYRWHRLVILFGRIVFLRAHAK